MTKLVVGWRWSCALALMVAALGGCAGDTDPDESGSEVEADLERTPAFTALLKANLPGFSVALVDEQGVLWSKGYGVASLSTRAPVTADTAFWLASVSKAVMGAALAHAEEHEHLSLETDVRRLVKRRAGFDLALPRGEAVSLDSLVTHTSPIRDSPFYACSYFYGSEREHSSLFNEFRALESVGDPSLDGLRCDDDSSASLGGFLGSYLSQRGNYYSADNYGAPGAPVYSNVGAALAGYALELATGTTLADYAETYLFRPLRMTHTSWELDHFSSGELAAPYAWEAKQGDYVGLPLYSLSTWPDGGLRSSARDLGTFLAAIMHGGELFGARILKPASVERLLTPRVTDPEEGVAIGTFWTTFQTESGQLVGHNGGDPGAATLMLFEPQDRVGFVLLTNTDITRLVEPLELGLPDTLLNAARELHASHAP